MIINLDLNIEKPRYYTVSDITFAQVDAWFGHTTRDLKLDLIYPQSRMKKVPCIVWICGGGWIRMDKSAHLAYLAKLALNGFAVASVEYRTSNEGAYPMPLEDVKAAIRYLKAHAERYCLDENKFGVAGESAGGYLAAMCAHSTTTKALMSAIISIIQAKFRLVALFIRRQTFQLFRTNRLLRQAQVWSRLCWV